MQADRRRINAPAGGTAAPVFTFVDNEEFRQPLTRTRKPDEHRKIFLRTGVVPSASGSAYYEVPPQIPAQPRQSIITLSSSLKITCTVHGPRPLPRNAPFSPNLLLTTHLKFAPFATRQRRGYVRDASERDLGAHLETALRGVVIGERWPKSALEVVVTVLEGEDDAASFPNQAATGSGCGMMNVLAGCITVAGAALVDAGVDCVDLVSGGVAALLPSSAYNTGGSTDIQRVILDPSPVEHQTIQATCLVAYLQSRDEITELWIKGDTGRDTECLVDGAVKAARMTRTVLVEAVKEGTLLKMEKIAEVIPGEQENGKFTTKQKAKDVIMTG